MPCNSCLPIKVLRRLLFGQVSYTSSYSNAYVLNASMHYKTKAQLLMIKNFIMLSENILNIFS